MSHQVADSATDLEPIADKIRTLYKDAVSFISKGIRRYYEIGRLLWEARGELEGKRVWNEWLKGNVDFSRMNAHRYMKLAKHWDKCKGAVSLAEAMRILSVGSKKKGESTKTKLTDELLNQWLQQKEAFTLEQVSLLLGKVKKEAKKEKGDWLVCVKVLKKLEEDMRERTRK